MKWKVAMVSYKNTKPFLFGLEKHPSRAHFDVELLYPAACSQAFENNEAEIALVPVAFLENRSDYKIITDYCIGCNGAVNSVAIFAERPITELSNIILDNHSMTSNRLCKILMENFWNKEVSYVKEDVTKGVENLPDDTGVVMIGDKVFEHQSKFKYKYDLGEAWLNMTGFPFVFAVWIAKPNVPNDVAEKLNETLGFGVDNIEEILSTEHHENFDLREYLTLNLEFNLFDKNRHGLDLFLNKYKLPAVIEE